MFMGPHSIEPAQVKSFTNAIWEHGGRYLMFEGRRRRIFAFVDGTIRPTCRPVLDQRLVYNGWKHVHGLKFQACVGPEGICYDLVGPFSARVADPRVYGEALTAERVRIIQDSSRAVMDGGMDVVLYGDPAYAISHELEKRANGTLDDLVRESAINKANSGARVAVEWFYGQVVGLWPMLDRRYRLRIMQCNVGGMYRVAVFLTNVRNCHYGGIISSKFNVCPLSPQKYISTFRGVPDSAFFNVNARR
jgi:hypothetical protein